MLWMPLSAPPLSSPCSFYCLVSGRTLLDSSWLKICWQSCQWLGWLCWIGRNCSTQMAWGQPGMRTRKICSFNRSCRSSFVWTDFWSVWVLHWVWISVSRDGFWASIFRDIFIAVLPSGFWSLGASYFRVPQCASSRSQASAEVIGCEGRGYNFPAAGPHTWGQRTWVPSCSASACWSGWQVLCWRLRADSVWTDMRCCWNPRSFQLIYSNLYRQKYVIIQRQIYTVRASRLPSICQESAVQSEPQPGLLSFAAMKARSGRLSSTFSALPIYGGRYLCFLNELWCLPFLLDQQAKKIEPAAVEWGQLRIW